jgi:uncharacterized protein YoxC
MDPFLLVFACLALAAFTVLCIVAAMAIKNLTRQLDIVVSTTQRAAADLQTLRADIAPVLTEATSLLTQLKATTANADAQLTSLGRSADAIAGIVGDVRALESRLLQRLGPPLEQAAGVVAGVTKGVATFIQRLVQ